MKNPFIRLFRARDKPGATDSVSSAPTFYFGSSAAGKSVTASTAIQMSTVYACVRVIAETIAGLNPKPVDEATVPQIVFSFPEAASVGLTVEQAQAREDLIEIKETIYPMLANARMLMSGTAGSLTIVSGCDAANPDTPRVLGVHMVSQMASDIIAEAEQLVGNHVPLADAARLVHPHPTFSETLGEALLKADGRPLHTR